MIVDDVEDVLSDGVHAGSEDVLDTINDIQPVLFVLPHIVGGLQIVWNELCPLPLPLLLYPSHWWQRLPGNDRRPTYISRGTRQPGRAACRTSPANLV